MVSLKKLACLLAIDDEMEGRCGVDMPLVIHGIDVPQRVLGTGCVSANPLYLPHLHQYVIIHINLTQFSG